MHDCTGFQRARVATGGRDGPAGLGVDGDEEGARNHGRRDRRTRREWDRDRVATN